MSKEHLGDVAKPSGKPTMRLPIVRARGSEAALKGPLSTQYWAVGRLTPGLPASRDLQQEPPAYVAQPFIAAYLIPSILSLNGRLVTRTQEVPRQQCTPGSSLVRGVVCLVL